MNETRSILEQSVNRLFDDALDWAAQTDIEQTGFPEALWSEVLEQGMHLVLANEDNGGMAGDWGDACVVFRACGRHAVPLPLAELVLAHGLARDAGLQLPEGVPGLISDHVRRENNTLVVEDARVPWGRRADYWLAMIDNEICIATASDELAIESSTNIGLDPRDRVRGAVSIDTSGAHAGPADRGLCLGALMRSAQIAGGGAAALDLAIQYTSEREQFGRPLAKFQAIQHYLADLAGTVASVDAMSMAAADAFDQRGLGAASRDAHLEIAAAKCRASEAVENITRLAHQVHGAIGFTYEYGLHFVTRRLWSWRAEFGSAGYWGSRLGGLALDVGGDGIWPQITAD